MHSAGIMLGHILYHENLFIETARVLDQIGSRASRVERLQALQAHTANWPYETDKHDNIVIFLLRQCALAYWAVNPFATLKKCINTPNDSMR
jgi:hypothetical protein